MSNSPIRPSVGSPLLRGLPKAVVRRINFFEIFRDALSARGNSDPYGPVIALSTIESALEAARRQQRRIAYAEKSFRTVLKRSATRILPLKRIGLVFYDVHFYLIAWTRITKLAEFIEKSTEYREVREVLDRYDSGNKDVKEMRNHLEHFDERLPGGNRRQSLKKPNDLFNLTNHYVTFGGKRLDVGPDSIRLLTGFVEELRHAVFSQAIKDLEKYDKNSLFRHFRRARRDANADYILARTRIRSRKTC
jgi:hypothetical protein